MSLRIDLDTATRAQIAQHLYAASADFVPELAQRVDIDAYAEKLRQYATTFEAWHGQELVGLIAAYCNDRTRGIAFISSVSILKPWRRTGVARRLLNRCINHAGRLDFSALALEVSRSNQAAISFYRTNGFRDSTTTAETQHMQMNIPTATQGGRDYSREHEDSSQRRYAYGFDYDVMHHYMLRSFSPHFRPGSVLELGCFKGRFTQRLRERFDDITCVEASPEALREAKQLLGLQATFIEGTFENVSLPRGFDNVVMTHVLEHLDDPVAILRRINDEWLDSNGRLFLVCPNANAPSRQIAVKMGLISHNAAVTPAEAEHGHRRTYALDTLERDAVAAGLRVVQRSGIFFKALANFQWDRLLQTDIVSPDYLEGCYLLGQNYPDLCASVFLLCERGHK